MKSVIIGTAGHIDHGKTALVKALTGIDADRLEEEKRRGITIDLGFAPLELPGADGKMLRLGFVDVPGHERFVRNMLAGVGGIDLVLLVIAADESIKPQTREHFDICKLLGVRQGITALTKSDLVDGETLDVLRLEIAEFVRGSFLDTSHSPIIPVSSLTGAGLDDLRQALAKAAIEVPAKDSAALARLPIDRVFTMKGFGTVVTGTLISGTIRKEDEVEVFPKGKRARIRGVQVHGLPVEQAIAGQRTALNLAGIDKEELERGMVLAPPRFNSTFRADVSLSLLGIARPLKDRTRVHLYIHSSETSAEIALLDRKQIAPGETAFAQLRLADPLLLLPGDRFIIRQLSPVATIGGGSVLDAAPLTRKRNPDREPFLRVLESGDRESILQARVARRTTNGLSLSQAVAETGWQPDWILDYLSAAIKQGHVLTAGDCFFTTAEVEKQMLFLQETLANFHKKNPLMPGMGKNALGERLDAGPEILASALAVLLREGKIEVEGDLIRLAGRGVVMKDDEAEAKRTIEQTFASAGLTVPTLKDVLAGLKLDKIRAQKIITLLLRDKVLVKVSEDLVFHRTVLDDLRRKIADEKARSSKIDVSRFKDLTGVTRKYAIPLLEYLDRERVTRRIGNERLII